MTDICEYEQEGFCLFEDYEGFDAKCQFKDSENHCTAKPGDIPECCEFCGDPDCYGECIEEKEDSPVEKEKVNEDGEK